jgi:hypothetical protein
MTKRKRLIWPFGAAEADSFQIVTDEVLETQGVYAVHLFGDPVCTMQCNHLHGRDEAIVYVPFSAFGNSFEVHTL